MSVISGNILKVMGSFRVQVRHESDRLYSLSVIVVDSNKKFFPLMGRDWLDVLYPEWRCFFVHDVSASACVDDKRLEGAKDTLIAELTTKYKDVFSSNLEEPMSEFVASIHLREDARPIFYRPYDVPFSLREKVSDEIDRLVRENILVPVKRSEWASPIVVVPKANGEVRICMDCKVTVNKMICNEHYPLPNINDVFAQLSGYQFFAKLDLQGAYMQISVSKESEKYLVINTHKGLYAFQRLPFGISSAASTFQRVMDEMLNGIKGVVCYLDDILLGSDSIEGLVEKIHEVLKRLQEFKVKVNLNKSEFLVRKIQYLGHEISQQGLKPSEGKVRAIVEAPRPQNETQLKSFLGMINYYSKFIPNLSPKLSPLYSLLKKHVRFVWSDECERIFTECKKLLLSHNLLELYDPDLPIVVVCDSSSDGVGAVLCHVIDEVEKPVFYVSSTLSEAEKKYPNLHREALAVVFGLNKFFKYIYGKKFTVVTDNKPLASIFNLKKGIPPLAAARLQKYAYILSIFDFDIVYRKGTKIPNADALSRLPISGETGIDSDVAELMCVTDELPCIDLETIGRETQRDQLMKKLYSCVREGWKESAVPVDLKFYFQNQCLLSLHGDCVLYSEKVVVPRSCRLRVLELLHGCHLGVIRMKQAARRYVFWQGLDKEIEEFVNRCSVCSSTGKAVKKEYSSWPEARRPFERIHLDFFHLREKTFLILVDANSKWIDVKIMNRTDSDALITSLNSIFRIFGTCDTIVTDNGPPFSSHAFHEYANSLKIKLLKSPPYSPESNGLAERAVQTAKNGIQKLLIDPKFSHMKLSEIVEIFLFSYRNSYSQAIGCTPASKLFNFVPRTDLEINLKPMKKDARRVHFDIDVSDKRDRNSVKKQEMTDSRYSVGDLVWYKAEVRTMRSWVEAKVVGVNSKNTYYVDIDGSVRLASRNQMKKRMVEQDNYIYPKVETQRNTPKESIQPRTKKRPRENSTPSPQKSPQQRRSQRIKKKPKRFVVSWM